MISKEKQILMESFDKRSVKKNYTQNLMDSMLNSKQNHLRNRRKEEYLSQVEHFKKQGETMDINKLGHTQKTNSPTSRSSVRPFKPQTLQEQRIIKWEKELTEIQKWLDK